jgi:hypothetical protein
MTDGTAATAQGMAEGTAWGLPGGAQAGRPLCIGITVGLREQGESLWINGIKQNALYLARLFQHSPRRHQVVLVNTTAMARDAGELVVPWDTARFPVHPFDAVAGTLDVLIELGGQISEAQTQRLHARGAKVVSYCCGPEYVQMMEAMIFGRRLADHVFINQEYDAVWVIPQVMETSAAFFGTLRRQTVQEVPFVWDPLCLEQQGSTLVHAGEYRPRGTREDGKAPGWRVTVMEPNVDVLKFCLYPTFITEHAYRQSPGAIGYLHVCNADHLAQRSPEFAGVVRYLDLVRDGRASFVGRYETPRFLSEHTDVVVSHQWGLALNYFYFDVCWNGYALVHNASLCRELGYYYEGNDVLAGAQRLLEAVQGHDGQWEAYRARQRALIAPYLATDPALVARYDALLDGLTV